MFCPQCGANNEDGAAFCQDCGAALTDAQAPTADAAAPAAPAAPAAVAVPAASSDAERNKKVGIIAVAAVAVVVLILILRLFLGGGSSEKVALKFIKASFSGDAKTIVNQLPGSVVDYCIDNMGYDDKAEMIDELAENLEGVTEAMKDAKDLGLSVSYSVKDTEDFGLSELRNLKERYENRYDEENVKEAQWVEVSIKATYKGESEKVSVNIPVVKIGGKWYVDFENFSMNSIGSIFNQF